MNEPLIRRDADGTRRFSGRHAPATEPERDPAPASAPVPLPLWKPGLLRG